MGMSAVKRLQCVDLDVAEVHINFVYISHFYLLFIYFPHIDRLIPRRSDDLRIAQSDDA